MTLVPKIKELMQQNGQDDVLLLVGGIIPEEDTEELLAKGSADKIFTPGDPLEEITGYIFEQFKEKSGA